MAPPHRQNVGGASPAPTGLRPAWGTKDERRSPEPVCSPPHPLDVTLVPYARINSFSGELRRNLDLSRDGLRNRRGLHLAGPLVHCHADDRERTMRNLLAVELPKRKVVGQRLASLFAHPQVDLHLVLEAQRASVFADRADAGPAEAATVESGMDGEAEGAKEGVLGGLHVAE